MPPSSLHTCLVLFLLLQSTSSAPCDIFASGGTPCVAAHSMVRGLYSNYTGTLYTLARTSDNATLDITPLSPGGYANATAHDEFCSHVPPSPSPSPPPSQLLPPLGTQVTLAPLSSPTYTFRHCYSQGFITPSESNPDHFFKLVAGLDGTPNSLSFQSVNFPGSYIAPVSGAEPGRVGILASPSPAEASWAYTKGPSGGVMLTSLSPSHTGEGLVVGGNLTGMCAHSYTPPSASVYLKAGGGGDAWSVSTAVPGPPSKAACVVYRLYDQTGNGNHLVPADPGINNPAYDLPVNATKHPITVGGHKVYGAFFEGGMGYRARNTTGVARGNDPETLYMVTGGLHVNDGCCFDYGSSENFPDDPSSFCDGCMEAIYFGTGGGWCDANPDGGPWVKFDLENGLYACGEQGGVNKNNTALKYEFVTAMGKGNTDGFALKGANGGSDATPTTGALKLMYSGPRPPGYQPMHKTGAIILGVGGDNVSKGAGSKKVGIPGTSIGTFYEGVLTQGFSSDAVDDLVQQDILATGYGK